MNNTSERNIKELLILLRDNAEVKSYCFGLFKRINDGLRVQLAYLFNKNIISAKEYSIIYDYIILNRPDYKKNSSYGWKPSVWKPRLKWLNEHINKL